MSVIVSQKNVSHCCFYSSNNNVTNYVMNTYIYEMSSQRLSYNHAGQV